MFRRFLLLSCFAALLPLVELWGATEELSTKAPANVVIIPVRDQIARPTLYILRRGLKEAINRNADAVVLDVKTPGGALDVTLEMLEALEKFPGKKFAYVNDEAMSAGAFICAATDEIWFSPRGKMGAAAPVNATGQEIEKSMRQKIISYLRAEVRTISEGKGYRGDVLSAMIDENFELKIGDKVVKPKGELLTLTASEASMTYGDPPKPLLASGIAKSITDLLTAKFGERAFVSRELEITWSERLAVLLNAVSPVLLGLGLLALFIEFKTPGFGFFGIAGIVCLAIVFLSNYVAGFSGHEPILVFFLGLLLVALEIFFFPGVAIVALFGLVLMLGALVWSMADLWPNEPFSVAWTGDAFVAPLRNLGFGLVIAIGLGLLLARFLPHGWVWDKLVVQSTVSGSAQVAGGSLALDEIATLVGRSGLAVTALRPSGQVEIEGRRYEARVEIGGIDRGQKIVVRSSSDFGLIVEETA